MLLFLVTISYTGQYINKTIEQINSSYYKQNEESITKLVLKSIKTWSRCSNPHQMISLSEDESYIHCVTLPYSFHVVPWVLAQYC